MRAQEGAIAGKRAVNIFLTLKAEISTSLLPAGDEQRRREDGKRKRHWFPSLTAKHTKSRTEPRPLPYACAYRQHEPEGRL